MTDSSSSDCLQLKLMTTRIPGRVTPTYGDSLPRRSATAVRFAGCILTLLIAWSCVGNSLSAEEDQAGLGYPRPFSFRAITSKRLPHMDWMTMVVSDMHLRTRKGVEAEFKQQYPDRPVLVQINTEGLGLWGTWICLPPQRLEDIGFLQPTSIEVFTELNERAYPMLDFPGHWTYEAGADTTATIPAGAKMVTIGVEDVKPFLPSSHPHSTGRLKQDSFQKDIVICPRDGDGRLDWLRAEFASIQSLDIEGKSVTVRRWTTDDNPFSEHAAGTYLAPNANQIVLPGFPPVWNKYLNLRPLDNYTPFLPNVTSHCPRDPRTGLNAAETLAKHFIDVKQRLYPTADGFVLDVSAGTFHPSDRISFESDCDVDGTPDYFYFDGLDHWALGMYDYFVILREGVPGKFEGLGPDLMIASDANSNDEARFFDLMNGAEYEFGMLNPWGPRRHQLSSALDRYLLWTTRSRTPRVSYIHNKNPVDSYHGGTAEDLDFYMHDNYYRLDIAAACMGTGYVGKEVSRPGGHPAVALPQKKQQKETYGTTLPLDWDEYHAGDENRRNWLGQPLGPPVRLTDHLGTAIITAEQAASTARISASDPYEAEVLKSSEKGTIRLQVNKVLPWEEASFKARLGIPVGDLEKDTEYTLRFSANAPSPYARVDARYASIPRNLHIRLVVDGTNGPAQETLVFSESREIYLTLTAPKSGPATLQFGVGEEPGRLNLEGIELSPGCCDVLYRPFEGGLALLNGSAASEFTFPLDTLLPGQSYRRIKGTQDPEHNSGEAVGARLTLSPRDGILLLKARP